MRKINIHSMILAAAIVSAIAVSAEEKIVMTGADGSTQSINIDNVEKITFSADGSMVQVVTPAGTQSLPVEMISSITFDLTGSGQSSIDATLAPGLDISLVNGSFSATADGTINVAIYRINGQGVGAYKAEGQLSLDLNTLLPGTGVYIIKVNDKTIKYIY